MISSISDSSQQFMVQMMQQRGDPSGTAPTGNPMQEMMENNSDSIADKLGVDSSTFATIAGEIDAAVEEATEGVDGRASKETVDDAISGVLSNYGITLDELQSALQSTAEETGMAPMGGMGGMKGMGGPPPMGGAGGAEGTDSEEDWLEEYLESLQSDSESEDSSGFNIMQLLGNLPTGSLTNVMA